MPDGGIVPQYLMLDIERELANWVAWVRSRPQLSSECASIYRMYRPPKHFHPESPFAAVDLQAALSIERAIGLVPIQHRRALILHYAWLAPSSFICRKLGLRHVAWEQFLGDARTMLTNLLLQSGKWRIPSSDNSTPSSR